MGRSGRRCRVLTVADRRQIPDYSRLTVYPANEQELAPYGVASVGEFVALANARFIASGSFPVTQGDFPSNRGRFERLVRRYRLSLG
jgi:hypothetical protein